MAVKPTQQPEIWASATLYASGPKVGQPTKASSEAGAAVEGHKPGPTEPTTANEFNIFENKLSLFARWVFEGRFDKAADAHIVETDGTGLLSARAADVGDSTSPGPSLSVSQSNTDWAAKIDATADGLQIDGVYAAAANAQLAFLDTDLDNANLLSALRVRCSGSPSCGGITVDAIAQGTIAGQSVLAGINVTNSGGTGVQVRTSGSVQDALRVINTTNGGVSARFGHGNLEASNLDGTAVECRGGDADGDSGFTAAGDGLFAHGGAHTLDGATDKPAGNGITAISGQSSTIVPGGAAVYAETFGTAAIAVEATHNSTGATLPVITATTGENVADGITVSCEGAGDGVRIAAENGDGLRVTMDPNGGGDIGPAIHCDVQFRPTVVAIGQIWHEQSGPVTNWMTVLTGTTHGYIPRVRQSPCYARSAVQTGFVLSGVQADQAIGASFTWEPGLEPAEAAQVRVTIWGEVQLDASAGGVCTLAVRDTTEGGNPKILEAFNIRKLVAVAGTATYSTTKATIYTLPASGARTFDLVWTGDAGAESGNFRGYVEIEQIAGS